MRKSVEELLPMAFKDGYNRGVLDALEAIEELEIMKEESINGEGRGQYDWQRTRNEFRAELLEKIGELKK